MPFGLFQLISKWHCSQGHHDRIPCRMATFLNIIVGRISMSFDLRVDIFLELASMSR